METPHARRRGVYVWQFELDWSQVETHQDFVTQLKIQTQERERENRRIELVIYALTDKAIEKKDFADYHFGDIRLKVTGKVQGSAGANLALSGKVDFDVNKRVLQAGGLLALAWVRTSSWRALNPGKKSRIRQPSLIKNLTLPQPIKPPRPLLA